MRGDTPSPPACGADLLILTRSNGPAEQLQIIEQNVGLVCSDGLVEASQVVNIVSDLLFILSRLDFGSVIDILLVALVFYWILQFIQGTQAVQLLRGILILSVLAVIAASALNTLVAFSWLIDKALPALLVAIPVIFQPELRRALGRVGRTGGILASSRPQSHVIEESIEAVSQATIELARDKHGALIVFERETGLEEFIESGVRLEAVVTPDLLKTIFFPNTALHDGSVIVRGNRIIAASAVLPLSNSPNLAKHLVGTRHRAGLGITEVTDAIAIIISEETGVISVAHNGHLIRGIDKKRLEQLLQAFYHNQMIDSIPNGFRTGRDILQRLGLVKADKPVVRVQPHSKR